jgi:hypothetical protein
LWNPEVDYRFHKRPTLVSILSQVNSIHTIPSYISKIHLITIHPPTSWSLYRYSSLWFFPNRILYKFLIPTMLATCSAHLILHELITLIICGKVYNYQAPRYAVFYILLSFHSSWVQLFSSAPYCQTPSVCVFPITLEAKFHTHTNYGQNYSILHFLTADEKTTFLN